MRYEYIGKQINVTDGLKAKVEEKLGKLERVVPADSVARVLLTLVKNVNIVEVTIPLNGRNLRAQTKHEDLMSAVDAVVDILQKQMEKYKGRLQSKKKRDSRFKAEYDVAFAAQAEAEEQPVLINRTKRFALKPMDAEEAVIEMELIGHSFYVFKNASTDEVNVVYRQSGGEYGLIEPEF